MYRLAGRLPPGEVLGVQVTSAENGAGSLAFFRDLVARGLTGRGRHVLRGLRRPEGTVRLGRSAYPAAVVQACLIHLIRNTFRYASKKY